MNYKDFTLITADSRKVIPGALFVAVKGYASDGHNYIQSAIDKGAKGIICEHLPSGTDIPEGVEIEVVENSRKALALAADEFYDHPSRKLTPVGITGTNGKTTTVTLLYNLFRALGYQCGLLSTIANYVGDERFETENTTVDPVTLNELMARMVKKGCQYCFMEVSSIGVEQDRVTGLDFKLASSPTSRTTTWITTRRLPSTCVARSSSLTTCPRTPSPSLTWTTATAR